MSAPDIPQAPGLTVHSTLGRGDVAGRGTDGPYRRLAMLPGEPHIRRIELAPEAKPASRRESLLHLAHVTDAHILDTASPGRLEFAERFHGPLQLHLIIPAYRAQESLQLHACEAMIRTINRVQVSPLTGAPLQMLLCTGDLTDNAQSNELRIALRLLEGGAVRLWEGGAEDEGVESNVWGDPEYWHPGSSPDLYKKRWGFPAHPGLLEEAAGGIEAQGVALPWISCFGNHDALVLGTALHTEEYERIVTGSEKPRFFPLGFDPLDHIGLFIEHPERFMAGPTFSVPAHACRHASGREEFVRRHLKTGGGPSGHGFSKSNLKTGTAYFVDDRSPSVRLISLDTVNTAGDYQGSIGVQQASWLEQRLVETHSQYWDASGALVETGNRDRLVVIASHHGMNTLTNGRAHSHHEMDCPRLLGPDVESLLHRFPNVVLWLNGHTHRNLVHLRPDPSGRSTGFWEVTTSSLIDWPCQARLVEILANDDGTVSVLCTMIDHAAPADPTLAEGLFRLASIHRELAANDPHMGPATRKEGTLLDRNVELVVPAPFRLG